MAKQWKQSLTSSDVQAEAEDALEKDINNLSPASNSIADNLDGGVAAVDWASKTAETGIANGSTLSVNGSGYILSFTRINTGVNIGLTIDGSTLFSNRGFLDSYVTLFRFESSFDVQETNGNAVLVSYVLD